MRRTHALAIVAGVTLSVPAGITLAAAISAESMPSREVVLPTQGIAAQVSDVGGRDIWAMRMSKPSTDLTGPTMSCYVLGVMRNGNMGAVDPNGLFIPYPVDGGGTCVGPIGPRSVSVALRTIGPSRRIVLHGFVGAEVTELTLKFKAQIVKVRPSPNGAVLHVAIGSRASRPTVSASFTDGTAATIMEPTDLPATPPKPQNGPVTS